MEDKKTLIYDCAKEIFSIKGFKDTNISDITKKAGMAVGTFYNYYPSKEKLFMDIYLKENEKLKINIMESIDTDEDPIKMVKEATLKNLEGMKLNPILKEWYNRDLFSKLEKEFYNFGGIKSINEVMNSSTLELIKLWKSQGKLRDDIEDEMMLAIFNAIPYIDIHKEELGVQHFPLILEYFEEFIMKGLMVSPKNRY